ncbi:MAG: immunoglobulin-like domain-containing protein, partial [Patescibacteria group bacterium]
METFQRDTIVISAGTYKIANSAIRHNITGSGPITIKPATGAAVIFQMNSTSTAAMITASANPPFEVIIQSSDGTMGGGGTLTFTNNDGAGVSQSFLNTSGTTFRVRGVTFDYNNVSGPTAGVIAVSSTNGYDGLFELSRSKMRNIASNYYAIRDSQGYNQAKTIIIQANEFDTVPVVLGLVMTTTVLPSVTITNNTAVRVPRFLYSSVAFSSLNIANNIFIRKGTGNYFLSLNSIAGFQSSWVKNNFVYSDTLSASGDFEFLRGGGIYVVPVDKSNHLINPTFTAYGTEPSNATLTLSNVATNYVGARGSVLDLPSGGDINGISWSLAAPYGDVGAYTNTGFTAPKPFPSLSGASFFGDSISAGGSAGGGYKVYEVFPTLSGVTTASANAAVPGLSITGWFWLADKMMLDTTPATTFGMIGANNFGTGSILPSSTTTVQNLADIADITLEKISAYGSRPIWLGSPSEYGNPPTNINTKAFNAATQTYCNANGWVCDSLLDRMEMSASTWKTDYYTSLINNVHPNDAGHAFFAALADYLYFTKYTMGTNLVDIAGGAKIYADGKFRNLNTPNSSLANFSVTPLGGVSSFDSNSISHWLDITIDNWQTTGAKNKQWTAGSIEAPFNTHATSTIYTIGDLKPDTAYTFKLDGSASTTAITGHGSTTCTNGVCVASDSGAVSFVYNGGYSTRTFALEDLTPPVLTEITPVPTPSDDTTPSYVFSSTEAGTLLYSGSCIPSSSTSIFSGLNTVTFNALSDGTYTNCQISVIDSANNNSATTTLPSFTIITTTPDTTPPTITLSGPNPTSIYQYHTYTDPGATASDNVDGDLTSSITTVNPVNTSIPGTYTITYNVTDNATNPATQV